MTTEYAVGDFQVRPAERSNHLLGRPVALGARAFDLLLTLIERRTRGRSAAQPCARAASGAASQRA
jgi:DNA-binding response OmpR family regulator